MRKEWRRKEERRDKRGEGTILTWRKEGGEELG
jgi:hypothetical protein